MATDRWRQVEDLCHAALARPAEERRPFLVKACEGDEALLKEVESLIAQESVAEAFMSVPAAALAGSAALDQPRAALVGARFGSYSIRSLLGIGGMGEVYRAHDDTLGREVAIKLLSPSFTAEPERRARFEREARMLATLNHPHIGAIYGVEEADGVRGLVLELVEGATLAERIAASARPGPDPTGLPMNDALTIARQIVDALEAAHEKGIVHRDLKPANIKITPDGVVKVLDFGLAKVASPDSSSSDPSQSRAGAIFGTAAYMSPEQARGQNVDKRADIWAFGCVLFEMLSGRVAFAGETASDTIAKILEHDPDWSAIPAATPARIRRVLRRCLTKDPKQRLRDIGDVRLEMDSADDAWPSVSDAAIASSGRKRTGTTWLPWLALAAIAATVAVWEVRRPRIVQESPLANAHFSRFTDWEGMEGGAEISPDGKFVTFKADKDGEADLWVKQVGTGPFRNLTQNIAPLLRPGGIVRTFGFNGDGSEIWFSEGHDTAAAPKWLVPVTGGEPRPFMGKGSAAPSWSPEDAQLMYFTNGNGDPFFIADRTGANARKIAVDITGFFAGTMHNHNPVWSQDGKWIYFAHGPDADQEMNVWRVRPSGGTPEQLTTLRAAANHLAVIDQHTVLYVAPADDGSGPWLWSLDVDTKATQRVISGVEHYSSVSASRDGRHVVTTVSNPTASLWSVPLRLDRQAEDRDAQPYALPSARASSPRFGGQSLFYVSQDAGDVLWRVQDEKASEVWKAASDSLAEPPAVSRDGTRVAVIIRQEKTLRLLMMSADGTNARTLAPSITIQSSDGHGSADWSPDGAWIVVAGTDDVKGPGLFKIPVDLDGSTPVLLVSGQVVNPVWSPLGDLIVYGGPSVGGQVTLLGVKPDGTSVKLPEVRTGRGGSHRFLPNGTGLVYLPYVQSRDFSLLDFATKKTLPLARLGEPGKVSAFDITPDGKAIVFDRLRDNSDIVLIDLPK